MATGKQLWDGAQLADLCGAKSATSLRFVALAQMLGEAEDARNTKAPTRPRAPVLKQEGVRHRSVRDRWRTGAPSSVHDRCGVSRHRRTGRQRCRWSTYSTDAFTIFVVSKHLVRGQRYVKVH